MEIEERMRQLRKDRNYTLKQLAQLLNTTIQYYQKYEKGLHPLPVDRLYQLADFYQVSADYILGRTEDPTPPKDAKPYETKGKAK